MIQNNILSFVIPTYNRAGLLDDCIFSHIEICKKHNLKIYISDNCSTDNTKEIVEKWQNDYDFIEYYVNEKNIGAVKNVEKALSYSNTKYTWLLGDTYQLPFDGIEYIVNNCKDEDYDVMVFNIDQKNELESMIYTDCDKVLSDLGGIMSCLSSLVFSKRLLGNVDFLKSYETYYPHTYIVFNYISNYKFKLCWFREYLIGGVSSIANKKTWNDSKDVFKIGAKGWQDLIFSLPDSYNYNSRMKAIYDFGTLSGIFKFKKFLKYRKWGILTKEQYRKYSIYINRGFKFSDKLVYLIVYTPFSILLLFYYFSKLFNYKKHISKLKKIWKK